MGRRAAHSASIQRGATDRTGITLSGAISAGVQRLDPLGLGKLGEQSAGKILPPDRGWQEAIGGRTGNVGSVVGRNCPGTGPQWGGAIVIAEFLSRLRFFVFRKKPGELEDELRFHLEQSIAAKVATGISSVEALRQTLIEFGGVEGARELCIRERPGQ